MVERHFCSIFRYCFTSVLGLVSKGTDARESGFFSVEDAWHFLATQGGCGRINLVVAEPQEQDRLRPLSPAVRLSG